MIYDFCPHGTSLTSCALKLAMSSALCHLLHLLSLSFPVGSLLTGCALPSLRRTGGRCREAWKFTCGSAHGGRCSCPQWEHSQDSRRGIGSGPCLPDPGTFSWAGTGWGHTQESHRHDLQWGDGRKQSPSMSLMGPKPLLMYDLLTPHEAVLQWLPIASGYSLTSSE